MNETPDPDPDPKFSDLGRAMLGGGSGSASSGSKPSGPWIPPSPEQLQALLPQYEILAMLGRGGMGAVYMGKQVALDRPVAIKILSGALEESDLGFKERFKNEARAMAKLSHPGIVAVFESGETADGLLYIVMEYVDGTDVARMIAAEGRLHTEYAMAISAHVCDALAYAHGSGIIHRDIKPANIMVGYNGVVKIADFGLAKVHANSEQSLGLTMSGMAMGTMHFMAPEALEPGVTVDQRADLYAVGVMLYQMLTGRVPRGIFELPSMQVPGLDPRYDGIIAMAMREDRDERYQNAVELRHDLDAILTQPVVKVEAKDTKPVAALPTRARPQRPVGKPNRAPQPEVFVRTEKNGAPLLWVAVVALAVLAAWLFFQRQKSDVGTASAITTASTTPASVPVPALVPSNRLPPLPRQEPSTATKVANTSTTTPSNAQSAMSTAAPASVNSTTVSDPPNTTKRTTDLLALVDLKRDVLVGNWKISPDGIELEYGSDPLSRLDFPLTPPAEYDFEIEFSTNVDLVGAVTQCFKSADRAIIWTMQSHPTQPVPVYGFYGDRGTKPEVVVGLPQLLKKGQRYHSVVRVRKGSLHAHMDGEELLSWKGDIQRFPEKWDRWPSAQPLGIGSWGGGIVFHKAALTEFFENPDSSKTSPSVSGSPTRSTLGLDQFPEITSRIANYQKTRHAQLTELTTKYRNALVAAKDLATKGGILADATAAESALAGATDFAEGIEANRTNTEVLPLPPLATLNEPAPARLKELREIFVTEVSKIESALIASLDQSLAAVQTTLVQAEKPTEASAVEGLRRNIAITFHIDTAISFDGPSPPPNIPTNAIEYGGSYYACFTETVRWTEAKAKAEALGGHLATFTTPAEESAVLRHIRDQFGETPTQTWIGAIQETKDGPWMWVTGEPFDYTHWDRNEPNNSVGTGVRAMLPFVVSLRDDGTKTGWCDFAEADIANWQRIITGYVVEWDEVASTQSAQSGPNTNSGDSDRSAGAFIHATKENPFTNSIGMKFVPVPGTDVLFCVHETRKGDYAAFAAEQKSINNEWRDVLISGVPVSDADDHPVVNVSWNDASSFCNWLQEKEGVAYRLPTDREWSLAVGLGKFEDYTKTPEENMRENQNLFPWGTSFPPPVGAGNYANTQTKDRLSFIIPFVGYEDGHLTTAPVMSFSPNSYGLYDMGGNVWEWCEDWFNNRQKERVLRGGSWWNGEHRAVLSSHRDAYAPNIYFKDRGFRVVLELP